MKESHLFYAPDLKSAGALPADEAAHAVRVLRMQEGDALWATDGCGSFYDCHIVSILTGRKPECFVEIDCEHSWRRPWNTEVCVAVAPTKHADRIEWLAEKATEIGVDRMVGLCFFGTESAEAGSLGAHRCECNETEPQSLPTSNGGDDEIEALFGATLRRR